jgi:nucleoside-diphosphate-sugar epimerase
MSLVLITGAGGEVGRGVLPFLERDFDLRLLDLHPHNKDGHWVQADILDRGTLARAMDGVDAVLHLAVASGHSGTFEDDEFNDRRFDINVKGTYHVLEAARRMKVRRVVHVSSVMATWGHALARAKGGQRKRIAGDVTPFPVGTYALTKALGEQIARSYFSPKMKVITLRIAAPLDLSDPAIKTKPIRPQQVPFDDLAQAFKRALKVHLTKFEIVTVVGDSTRQAWDLSKAKKLLAYKPRHQLDGLGLTFAADALAVEAR